MPNSYVSQSTIVRTERGLSVAGTRITLYTVLDYLKADWPPALIRQWLDLTEQQMGDAIEYIEEHCAEVEAEYQDVVNYAHELQRYWELRNRDRLANVSSAPPPPGREKIWAKLQARKDHSVPL